MIAKPLYSVGHGTRKKEELLALLVQYEIKYLVDVRSIPRSKYNPQYNRDALKLLLETNNMTYVFMGDLLGGRPKDVSCYGADGRVSYSLISQKEFFRAGIERLKTAYQKNIPLVFMCSESKPENCHRSRLITKALLEIGVPVRHIDENGALKSQDDLFKNDHPGDLFSNVK
jgi:uncharacterized protein (DUF488 family)